MGEVEVFDLAFAFLVGGFGLACLELVDGFFLVGFGGAGFGGRGLEGGGVAGADGAGAVLVAGFFKGGGVFVVRVDVDGVFVGDDGLLGGGGRLEDGGGVVDHAHLLGRSAEGDVGGVGRFFGDEKVKDVDGLGVGWAGRGWGGGGDVGDCEGVVVGVAGAIEVGVGGVFDVGLSRNEGGGVGRGDLLLALDRFLLV